MAGFICGPGPEVDCHSAFEGDGERGTRLAVFGKVRPERLEDREEPILRVAVHIDDAHIVLSSEIATTASLSCKRYSRASGPNSMESGMATAPSWKTAM